MPELRLPQLGRQPDRGLPLPGWLVLIASVLGVMTAIVARGALMAPEAPAIQAAGPVEIVARVRVSADRVAVSHPGGEDQVGVPIRWRPSGESMWRSAKGRLFRVQDGTSQTALVWEVEWVLGKEGDSDPLPESGTVIQIELGAEGTAVPPNVFESPSRQQP